MGNAAELWHTPPLSLLARGQSWGILEGCQQGKMPPVFSLVPCQGQVSPDTVRVDTQGFMQEPLGACGARSLVSRPAGFGCTKENTAELTELFKGAGLGA